MTQQLSDEEIAKFDQEFLKEVVINEGSTSYDYRPFLIVIIVLLAVIVFFRLISWFIRFSMKKFQKFSRWIKDDKEPHLALSRSGIKSQFPSETDPVPVV
jgi:hypothetical protein